MTLCQHIRASRPHYLIGAWSIISKIGESRRRETFADALTATPGGTDQRIETYLGQELWLLAKPWSF